VGGGKSLKLDEIPVRPSLEKFRRGTNGTKIYTPQKEDNRRNKPQELEGGLVDQKWKQDLGTGSYKEIIESLTV